MTKKEEKEQQDKLNKALSKTVSKYDLKLFLDTHANNSIEKGLAHKICSYFDLK
jgi:adenylate kinase